MTYKFPPLFKVCQRYIMIKHCKKVLILSSERRKFESHNKGDIFLFVKWFLGSGWRKIYAHFRFFFFK